MHLIAVLGINIEIFNIYYLSGHHKYTRKTIKRAYPHISRGTLMKSNFADVYIRYSISELSIT